MRDRVATNLSCFRSYNFLKKIISAVKDYDQQTVGRTEFVDGSETENKKTERNEEPIVRNTGNGSANHVYTTWTIMMTHMA